MKSIALNLSVRITTHEEWAVYPHKAAYRKELADLLQKLPSGGFLKLSDDVYIPQGETLTLPKNSTLVADGGVIYGEGMLKGNNTKIDSNFRQLFDAALSLSDASTWNVTLSQPEWFGDSGPDYGTDDAVKIQKAVDLIQSISPTNEIIYGGRVVCKPGSYYVIKQPVELPMGISFDGGNSNFIFDIDSLSDAEQRGIPSDLYFMFTINTRKHVAMRSQGDTIENIKLTNPYRKPKSAGIYCRSQGCDFQFIYSAHLHQTFRRAGDYLDNISLKNFVIGFPEKENEGDYYAIDMGYVGDNLLVDNIATYKEAKGNGNLLKINTCGGGMVQRLTNGNVFIANSSGIVFDSMHQEYGNIVIVNSQIEIRGLNHYKQPGIPAIRIANKSNSYEQRFVTIRNSIIAYNHNWYDFGVAGQQTDIELSNSAVVKIDNVFRKLKFPDEESSSLYGIAVNSSAFMQFRAPHSIQSIIVGNGTESRMLNDFISYKLPAHDFLISEVAQNKGKDVCARNVFPKGTYHYYAALLFDAERNVGHRFLKEGKEIVVSTKVEDDRTKAVRIIFKHFDYVGMSVRLYRQKEGEEKLYYVDVPVCTSYNLFFDFGDFCMFGERWKEVEQPMPVQQCTKYQYLGDNAIVHLCEAKSSGKWQKGDIITTDVWIGSYTV